MQKLKMFVGSSASKLDLAYAVQENLERDFEVTVWAQDVFKLNRSNLESLMDILSETDAGIFILAPDDIAEVRGKTVSVVRDNVIFELGLFIGKLGRDRAFLMVPRGDEELQLPSDLLGINPAAYESSRTDGNLTAALGPSCNRIRKALAHAVAAKALPVKTSDAAEVPVQRDDLLHDENDCLNALQSWMGSNSGGTNTSLIRFTDVDNRLKLAPGTAKRLIAQAAMHWNYRVARMGEETIMFVSDNSNNYF